MKTEYKIGDKVTASCPIYKNGKTFTGTITGFQPHNEKTAIILLDESNKTETFHTSWLTLIHALNSTMP